MSEFLAEASVLVRPDTTKFRALLEAQLLTATKGITVPINIVGAAGGIAATQSLTAANQAAQQATLGLANAAGVEASAFGRQAVVLSAAVIETEALAEQQRLAGASAVKTAAATNALSRAQSIGAAAVKRLGVALGEQAITTSALAAARVQLGTANAAVLSAERAVAAAVTSGNVALIDAASNTLSLAKARVAESQTALRAAIAERELAAAQTHTAATTEFARRGAFATALSLTGVRGATLAANSAFLVGAAGAIAFFKSISLASQVEDQLNVFRVTAKATGDEIAAVSEKAKELGRDIRLPAVSAPDAIRAMVELAKAGLSVRDSMSAAEGVLQLATAAQIDNAQATELVANALNAFGLQGADAVHVVDLLAAASNNAQGSIVDVGEALGQVAAVSRLVGIGVEDTVALLTLLAKNGLQGAQAGTALRIAFLRLVDPVGKARDLIDELGVKIRDMNGDFRPEIFADIANATRDWSKAQRDAAFSTLFGTRAIKVESILARENVKGLNDMRDANNQVGAGAELAGARTEGFSGSLEQLKNNLGDISLSLGQLAIPIAKLSFDTLNEGLGLLAEQLDATITQTERFFKSFGDDFRQVQQLSKDSGVTDFFRVVGQNAEDVGSAVLRANSATDKWARGLLGLGGSGTSVASVMDTLSTSVAGVVAQLNAAVSTSASVQSVFDQLTGATTGLAKAAAKATERGQQAIVGPAERLAGAEASGDQQAQLKILRNQRAALQARIDAHIALKDDRIKAKRQLDALNNQITAIEAGIAADRQRAQSEIDKRISDSDQKVIDSITSGSRHLDNAAARAALTASLRDDIAVQKSRRDFFKAKRDQVAKTVQDAKTKAQEIASLTADFITAVGNIRNLEQQQRDALRQQREDARAQRQDALDQKLEILGLNIQAADISGNKSKQKNLLKAEIDEIERQIDGTKKGSLRRAQLRVQLRQAQRDLADLTAEQKKTNQAAKDFTFEFLQKQQGFAANLLGNLIPGGATGGLVGGGAGPVSTLQGPTSPAQGVQTAAAISGSRDNPLTRGDVQTELHLLRSILNVLRDGNSKGDHPEAWFNRRVSGAAMDTMGV